MRPTLYNTPPTPFPQHVQSPPNYLTHSNAAQPALGHTNPLARSANAATIPTAHFTPFSPTPMGFNFGPIDPRANCYAASLNAYLALYRLQFNPFLLPPATSDILMHIYHIVYSQNTNLLYLLNLATSIHNSQLQPGSVQNPFIARAFLQCINLLPKVSQPLQMRTQPTTVPTLPTRKQKRRPDRTPSTPQTQQSNKKSKNKKPPVVVKSQSNSTTPTTPQPQQSEASAASLPSTAIARQRLMPPPAEQPKNVTDIINDVLSNSRNVELASTLSALRVAKLLNKIVQAWHDIYSVEGKSPLDTRTCEQIITQVISHLKSKRINSYTLGVLVENLYRTPNDLAYQTVEKKFKELFPLLVEEPAAAARLG